MFIVIIKEGQHKHWLLGDLIGQGQEHFVYSRNNKWVYKIYALWPIKNPIHLIKTVRKYLKDRNSIPIQMPCKFVGLAIMNNYIFPIFKLRKVLLLDSNYDVPKGYKDGGYKNFGLFEGRIVAIDVLGIRTY